jgi:hypothetical protein
VSPRPLAPAFLAALAAAAAAPPTPFEREIRVAAPGRVAATLDRAVYESARLDLGDLRVLDDRGQAVPFLLDRGDRGASPETRPSLRNRGRRPDGAAVAELDFGGDLSKDRLALRLSGDNFRRRVTVSGSADGRGWVRLVDEAWVFAIPGLQAARYEEVELPANDFRRLRVEVAPGPDEPERVAIADAWVPGQGRRPVRETVLEPRFTRAEDTEHRESWLVLDLGAAHQPFHAIELRVTDARFLREAWVEARRDAGPGAPRGRPPAWVLLGRGVVYRLDHGGRTHECLRLAVSGRERAVRVRLANRDDRPLGVTGVALNAPVERVVFEAGPGRHYRLTYGSFERAPGFDLAATVGNVGAWAGDARPALLGEARRVASAPAAVPWTERHRALLWGGLLAVVLALAALTRRALRS